MNITKQKQTHRYRKQTRGDRWGDRRQRANYKYGDKSSEEKEQVSHSRQKENLVLLRDPRFLPCPPTSTEGSQLGPHNLHPGGAGQGTGGSLRAPTAPLSRERAAGNCSVLAEAPPP